MQHPLQNKDTEEQRQVALFDAIRKNIERSMDEEQLRDLKRLGEKFHESFDVARGTTTDTSTINMEEALAYVVESLKSGIHPTFLDENETALLVAGYGEDWYKNWGYSDEDMKKKISRE